MERFLIEVPHEAEQQTCIKAVKIFMETGSYFMTHADYGSEDNERKAWIIVELEDKATAWAVVPPAYRAQAKIIKLTTYTFSDLQEVMERHGNG